MIIVNGFQPLTIITKLSIFDAAAALDPPLIQALERFHRHFLDVFVTHFVLEIFLLYVEEPANKQISKSFEIKNLYL